MWRKYDVTVTFMTLMSCDSVCRMCGEAWSSRWLMTQLTNGQHACVLVFMPMVDILNIPCEVVTVSLFSLYLMNFMFHTTLHAVGNILSVNYTSMKCDVSFSKGSVRKFTLFRWGEHVFHVCVKCSSCLQQCKNYNKNLLGDEIGNVNFYAVRPDVTRIRWNNAK